MNITPSLFRKLLLLSIIFAIVGACLDVMLPQLIPDPFYQAQEKVDQPASSIEFIMLLIIGISLVIAYIISVVGLFCFYSWAPQVALTATFLSLIIYPLLGYSLSSGWSLALTDCSTLLWGMILTLTYCSPLRKRFARRRS
jgi:urea transporter